MPGPPLPRRLKTNSIPWVANETKSEELPHSVYRGLHLKLTVTTTNSSASGFTIDALLNLVNRLNLVIDGQDNFVVVNLRDVYYMNYYDFSMAPVSSIDATDGSGKISYVHLYIPHSLTRAAKPDDTMLDVRSVATYRAVVTWNGAASVPSSGVTVTAATLSFNTDVYENVDALPEVGKHELSGLDYNLDQVGRLNLKVPYGGNHQYRRLFLFTRNSSSALSNVQIDDVIVKSNSFYYLDMEADRLQVQNARGHSIAAQTGVYLIDFTRDGRMTQRLDARRLNELFVDVNSLVSNGTIRILMDKVITN